MRELPKAQPPKVILPQAAAASASPNAATSSEPLRQQVLAWLKVNVPSTRFNHILRVEQMSIELAQTHKVDVDKAAQAGLMHDLAKYFKPKRLLSLAIAEGLTLDPIDHLNPHLLHADVGAIVARDQFGVEDEDVLDAIRNHTLGNPGMSLLSCVVYLADGLEPGRGTTPELEELRRLSRQDLIKATWRAADASLMHLIQAGHLIHPRTVQTRNWFLHQSKSATKGS